MLELTERTIAAVRQVADPDSAAGIRIYAESAANGQPTLSAILVEFPAEHDEVVEDQGARVYLDPDAAAALDGTVLDTHVDNGSLQLTVIRPT